MIVSDSSRDRVIHLVDEDGSGTFEADREGEYFVFYDDTSDGPDLSTPSALLSYGDGVLVLDGGTLDSVLLLQDFDGDGSANGVGEWKVFYDDSSVGPNLNTPNSLVRTSQGEVLIADDGGSQGLVLLLQDLNGDGQALGDDEFRVLYDSKTFAESTPQLLDPEAMAIASDGTLYITDATSGAIFQLRDLDQSGDFSNTEEVSLFYTNEGENLLKDPEGLSVDAIGNLYVTDEDTGLILKLRDLDGDLQAKGESEVQIFIDSSAPFGLKDTNDLTVLSEGSLMVLDGSRDQIFQVTDLDQDGLALSEGEVKPWLRDEDKLVGTPSSLIVRGSLTQDQKVVFIRGDFDSNGQVDSTDAVAILDYLFLGAFQSSCLDSGDADDDGRLRITDPIVILTHLFITSEPLPSPFSQAGEDPTEDALDCVESFVSNPVATPED